MSRLHLIAEPFPHAVEDGLWDPALLRAVVNEIPAPDAPGWRQYSGRHEQGKQEGSNSALWGPATVALLDMLRSPEWCAELGETFGIADLTADTIGGGYHQILTGGVLDMHVDFNRHPRGLHRRLNCLVYLNDGYELDFGGQLFLGADRQVTVEPRFNTTAVFATSDISWHGHPIPWAGPALRRSVAVYYFAPEPAVAGGEHSTVWLEA